MRTVSRETRRAIERRNQRLPEFLQLVDKSSWPDDRHDPNRIECWVSRKFVVQVFNENDGVLRITVSRNSIKPDGNYEDGITWDELQEVKRQIGRGGMFAVEIYPRDFDIVNVSNMRHLWVLPKPLDIGWKAA